MQPFSCSNNRNDIIIIPVEPTQPHLISPHSPGRPGDIYGLCATDTSRIPGCPSAMQKTECRIIKYNC